MNVEAFMAAMSAYNAWETSHPDVSSEAKREAHNIALTKDFENRIFYNPSGTLEQYLNMQQQQQNYYNSPRYQIDVLAHKVRIQEETIEVLNRNIENLKSEFSSKVDENDILSHYNTIWSITAIFFISLTVVLSIMIYKYTSIFQNFIDKFRKYYKKSLNEILGIEILLCQKIVVTL